MLTLLTKYVDNIIQILYITYNREGIKNDSYICTTGWPLANRT